MPITCILLKGCWCIGIGDVGIGEDGFVIREGVKKSKWKFKMAFAMKGGGVLEGVSSSTYLF